MSVNTNRIEFHQVRDFGEVLTVTFDFVRENFKPLMKAWLYIAGPFALIGAVIGIYSLDMMSTLSTGLDGNSLLEFGAFLVGQMTMLTLTFHMTYLVTLGYLSLYFQQQSTIEINDIWPFVKQNFWYLSGLYMVITIIVFIGFILLVIPGIYLTIVLSIAPIIRIIERQPILACITRSRRLISGFWWKTTGLIVVLAIIQLVFSGLLQAPQQILSFLWGFNKVQNESPVGVLEGYPILAIIAVIGQTFSHCTTIIPTIALSLQYFNLRERKEAVSLMDKVDLLETNEASSE